MDSKSLKPWQIKRIDHEIARSLSYLFRLRIRMEQCGFPRDDMLQQAVAEAERATAVVRRRLYEIEHGAIEPWDEATFQKYINSKPPDKRRIRRDERH